MTYKDYKTMGRPAKKNAEYFRHYAKNGKTKRILRQQLGHVGIACWWEILEMLTEADHHYIDVSKELEWMDLLATLDIDEETADKFFSLLVRLGKIDRDLWENHKIIWCQNLIDTGGIAELWLKRGKKIPTKPYFEGKQIIPGTENRLSETENKVSEAESPPSKAKQSRAKKSKEEQSKGNSPANAGLPLDDAFSCLLFFGVRKNVAERLCDEYDEEIILRKCQHFDWLRRTKKLSNPTGYLVKSIEEMWPPPAGYEEHQEKLLKSRRLSESHIESDPVRIGEILGEQNE